MEMKNKKGKYFKENTTINFRVGNYEKIKIKIK